MKTENNRHALNKFRMMQNLQRLLAPISAKFHFQTF